MNYNDPETVPPVWEVGDVILDRYEVKQVFTGGGMGLVYRVHHREWDIDIAVKSPRPEFFCTQQHVENFEREAETWVELGLHPHTVSCYYVRRLGGIPRLFAEFVEGGSLADWIRSRKLYEGGPAKGLERILDIAIQFAWGLHFSHEKGLIHQDVKPANVLMALDGTAKVSDFGLAKVRKSASESAASQDSCQSISASSGAMTPAYCSPEQARGETLSKKTDVWSWAVSVLEMLAGEIVWLSGPAATHALENILEVGDIPMGLPAIPSELGGLLRTCLLEQSRRPSDFSLITTQLRALYKKITDIAYFRSPPAVRSDVAADWSNRALAALELGLPEKAESCWKRATEADLWHVPTWFNWWLFQLRHRRADFSRQRWDRSKLINCASSRSEALLAEARLYLDRNQPETAFWRLSQQAARSVQEISENGLVDQSNSFEDAIRLLRQIKRHFPIPPIFKRTLTEQRAQQLETAYSELRSVTREDKWAYGQIRLFAERNSQDDPSLEEFARQSARYEHTSFHQWFSVFRLRNDLALINIRESQSFWIVSLGDLRVHTQFTATERPSAAAIDRDLTLLGVVSEDRLTVYRLPEGALRRTVYLPFELGWRSFIALKRVASDAVRFLGYDYYKKTWVRCRYSLVPPELNIPVAYEICKPASHQKRELLAGCRKQLREAARLLATASADNSDSCHSVSKARHLIEQVKLHRVSELEWELRHSWELLYPHYKKRDLRGATRGRLLCKVDELARPACVAAIVPAASHDIVLLCAYGGHMCVWCDTRRGIKGSLRPLILPGNDPESCDWDASDELGAINAGLSVFGDLAALAVAQSEPITKKRVIAVSLIGLADGNVLKTLVVDSPETNACQYTFMCMSWCRSERFLWIVDGVSVLLLSFDGNDDGQRRVIPIAVSESETYEIVGTVPGASEESLLILIATLKDGVACWKVDEIDASGRTKPARFTGSGTPKGIFVSPDYTVLVVVTGAFDSEGYTMFFSLAEEKLLFLESSGRAEENASVDWLEECRFALVSTGFESFVVDVPLQKRIFTCESEGWDGQQACFTNAGRSVILMTPGGPTLYHLDWELEDQTIYSAAPDIPDGVLSRWCNAGLTPVRKSEITAFGRYLSHHGFGVWSDATLRARVKDFRDRHSGFGVNSRPLMERYIAERRRKSVMEDYRKKKDDLTEQLTDSLSNTLLGEKIPLDVVNTETREIIIPANRKITKTLLRKLAMVHDHIEIAPSPIRNKIREIIQSYEHKFAELELERERVMNCVESGDDIDPGIMRISSAAPQATPVSPAQS